MSSYLGSSSEKTWQDITHVVEEPNKVHISATRYFDKDDDARDWKINTVRKMAIGFSDEYRSVKGENSKMKLVLENGFGKKNSQKSTSDLNSIETPERPTFVDLAINLDKRSCKNNGLRYSETKDSCYKKCLRHTTEVYNNQLKRCVYRSTNMASKKSIQALR